MPFLKIFFKIAAYLVPVLFEYVRQVRPNSDLDPIGHVKIHDCWVSFVFVEAFIFIIFTWNFCKKT